MYRERETEEVETTTEETAEETTAAAAPAASTGAVGTLNSDGGFDINGTAYVVSERYYNEILFIIYNRFHGCLYKQL